MIELSPKRLLILSCVFLLQGALYLGMSLEERIPTQFPLDRFPSRLGDWVMKGEEMLDEPTRALLQPDYSFMRGYSNDKTNINGSLFIGYFKSTQANHPGPHSPTVCLPGAGWTEIYQRQIDLSKDGGQPFALNEYVLQKGNTRLVVLYWYQNMKRTWAREVLAKVYMLPDFISDRRTDVALVRLTFLGDQDNYQKVLGEGKLLATQIQPALKDLFLASASEMK